METKTPRLIKVFAEHRVAANMLMALMILVGLFALFKLNTQFFPNFDLNIVRVQIAWPGGNAEDVTTSITRPLEQELRRLDDLKEITSVSRLGMSSVILEFNQGADMSDALNKVREQVSQIRNLPEDSEKPIITKVEAFETVAKIILTGPVNIEELRPVVYTIERELLDLGIAKINIDGLPEQQITIEIPSYLLAQLQLTLDQIATQIRNKSQDVPAGTIGKGQLGKQLRALQQKRQIKDFANMQLISKTPDRILRLKDIATIKFEPQEQEPLVFYQDKPAVVLHLLRTKSASALKNAEILQNWLMQFKPTLGPGIQIHVYDQRWSLIKERVNLLLKNGFGGLILIIGILLLFLHARIAWWVLIGIPTSFLAAIAILYGFGGSINMVSLFAMIMTLGIIVDDTIVVSEETLTQLQKGKNVINAVLTAARKMLVPVFASSLTTICAFIPLLLITGIIGTILFAIPLVVISVIIASLLECFFVLPGHLHHSLKKNPTLKESDFKKHFNQKFANFRDIHFRKFVILALRYRSITLSSALLLFILAFSLVYFGILKFTFFPSPEGQRIYASAQFTAGTNPNKVISFMQQVEQAAKKTNQELSPNKNLITTLIRFENQTPQIGQNMPNLGEQYAGIEVELLSPDKRKITNSEFMNAWRKNVNLIASIEHFTITTPRVGPPGLDVDVELSGGDINALKAAAIALMNRLKTEKGVSNIKDDIPFGQNQLIFSVNATGKAMGLTIQDISKQLRSAFSGALAEIFHTATDEVEVRVMLPEKERNNLSALQRFPILTPAGTYTPLETVITVKPRKGFDIIRHTNTKPTIHVTAEVNPKLNNENTIMKNLAKEFLPQLKQQYNINYRFTGRAEDQRETLQDMAFGLLLALALIYIILTWVFSSYGWPLVVMIAIPLGLTGAIFGHLIMGINLTLLSLFGLFGLSGIVVNDSIILLSTYKRLRNSSFNIAAAIVDASCQRFRAVLLTSLTTIAGLTPLLFERSLQAQFLIPMAVSISFGLAYATLLILIVIPTLLSVYEGMLISMKKT